ncbi:MAG TPA: hypothetical protein VII92_06745, partial [Anaerolineae bacterium]
MKVAISGDFRDLFRPLTETELEHAKASNLADPEHERIPPVVVWQCGKEWLIVDGHHTHKIRETMRVGGKPVKVRYHKMAFSDRQTAMAYAIHAQIGRRNLDASQIAMALAKLPKATRGPKGDGELFANLQKTPNREQLAEEAGIGQRTMAHADKVHAHGAQSVKEAVVSGDVSVSDASAVADLPKSEQTAALKKVKQGKAKTLRAAIDYGKCPNCAGTKWTEDDTGLACSKCHHPHGEPTGGIDDDRVTTQRQKTVKTVEALLRAFDDLHLMLP